MTKSALKGRADDPRACRGVIRATFLTFPMVIFLTLALSPLSANLDNSGKVSVQRCEAYADATPTPYGEGFLDAAANEAGLSASDFIASVAGVLATGTGCVIANSSGIVFNAAGVDDNLENLVEAADYPEWSSLSAEQQQAWGSVSNYQSAKFNALMDAFGLEGERDRFYSSSGNFEFSEDGKDKLSQLGRIGSNWANNIGVSIDNIRNAILNRSAVSEWFPVGNPGGMVFDGSQVDGWPSYLPAQLNYSVDVTNVYLSYKDNKNVFYVVEMASNIPVYCCAFNSQGNRWIVQFFSKGTFKTGANTTQSKSPATTLDAIQASYNGHVYYYRQYTQILANGETEAQISGVAVNVTQQSPQANFPYMEMILYSENEQTPTGGGEVEVPGYPENIPQGTVVYYPSEGINPNVSWPDYTETQRPNSDYNPNNQTGKPEWQQETSQNVIPLQNIKFDKLFPFCLMTDVKDLTEKIEDTITPGAQSDYLKIRIPMAYASDGQGDSYTEEIELDGTPLRDLLVMVRPFNQVLLLFLMVFSLVMFWKSILTGD